MLVLYFIMFVFFYYCYLFILRVYKYQRAQLKWRTSQETLQLPANRPKQHHPCCPRVHVQVFLVISL